MASGWICEYCETQNLAADARCVVCDQFPSITDPVGAEAPTSTFSNVRSPSPADGKLGKSPAAPALGSRGALPWILVCMGAVALVLLVVIVVLVARPRATDAVSTNTTAAAPPSSTAPSTVAPTLTSTTVATVVITTPATTLAAPTTAAPVTTATTAAPQALAGGGGSAPTPGTWTAIFISCDGQAACADAAQRFRSFAPAATLIAPGTYKSLRPFWVVASGSFASGADAAAFCRSVGRTSRDDCFGRFLSQDPSDVSKIVFPD